MLFPIKILMFLIQMCHFLNNWAFHAACKQCFDFSSLWFKVQLLSDISLATSFELSELVQLWPILNSNRPWKRYRCQLMLDSIKNCSPCAKRRLTHLNQMSAPLAISIQFDWVTDKELYQMEKIGFYGFKHWNSLWL